MEIIIQPDGELASLLGAQEIASLLRRKPDAVLGLSTGSTPRTLYRELVRLHWEEGLDFSNAVTFNLDEYLGLPADHPASYHHFMQEHLFRHINLNPARIFVPSGMVTGEHVEEYCRKYEEEIKRFGGIDLQILGLGTDGHIGFNEPSSSLASRTRIKTLTKSTREDNARFFSSPDDVPLHVITMGVGTIMEAHSVMLLAFGTSKAQAVAAAVEGPVTSFIPASILQMHPKVKTILDQEAASLLKRRDYYEWVYANKPAWQKPSKS